MNRIPEGPHAPAGQNAACEPSCYPPYPPFVEGNPPSPRPYSASPQIPLLPQSCPIIPNGGIPWFTPEGHNPSHPNSCKPMNGSSHEVSLDFRDHMGHSPSGQSFSVENTPVSDPLPPASRFIAPLPQDAPTTLWGGFGPAFYPDRPCGVCQPKAPRATLACDKCRARKAKCDENRPNCSNCKRNNLICVYTEVLSHRQGKTTQTLLDAITQTEYRLENRMKVLQHTQFDHQRTLQELSSCTELTQRHVTASAIEHDLPLKTQVVPTQTTTSNFLDSASQERGNTKYAHKQPVEHILEGLSSEHESELSIPMEHATAAHKLLKWPSIKKLLFPNKCDEDYVMRLEEKRGLFDVYRRGETSYTADGSQLPTHGSLDDTTQDSDADVDSFGNLKLDAATAQRYYESYLAKMYNFHPFLEQGKLEQNVNTFIRCYCRFSSSADSSTNCKQPSRDGPTPAKRRHSNESLDLGDELMETVSNSSRPCIGKNVDNAIVLLCLALGAICEVSGPVSGPIMDQRIDYPSQPISGTMPLLLPSRTYAGDGLLSPGNPNLPIQRSHSHSCYVLPMPDASQCFSSPLNEIRRNLSRRSVSTTCVEQGHSKHWQLSPGLSLYGYATGILGHLQGGNELEHVQAGLLAGLYASQLAHPFQSHAWISQASRACQVLVRSKRYDGLEEGPVQDLHKFAYWSCLQLESDLLEELDIPASGISRFEDRMGLPKGKFTIDRPDDLSATPPMIMSFYSAQIHLRKIVNHLYKVEKQGESRWSSAVQETLSMNLDLWRTGLPDSIKWKDTEEPAKEINAARMRAKYYGARYIIHRPLLYHALHYGHAGACIGSFGEAFVDSPTTTQQVIPSMVYSNRGATNMTSMSSDLGSMPAASIAKGSTSPNVQLNDLPKKLRIACKICTDSAILSAEAFDGLVGQHLVVPNIFSTAHEQFGMMLVLSATYMSSLSNLIDTERFDRLLRRTIGLLQSENISPTLRADARILTEIYQKIFDHAPDIRQQPTTMNYH